MRRNWFVILMFGFWILNLLGCATVVEITKGIAGVSTKDLEENRESAIKKTFNYDYDTCYNKTKEILVKMGSYIYAQDPKKQMLAIYISETDTTTVGIFFTKIDSNKTQIEISSRSTYGKERIAKRVFSMLEGLPESEEKSE